MIKKQFLKIACALSIGFLFAGCANEDMTDGSLPDGKYPLVINAVNVTGDVQTRVSENPANGNSSVWDWDGSEQIGVQLYENGETASYTLKSDKTLSATDNQLYWNSTATTTVYAAWYPFVGGTIDLSKQNTDGLAYVMKGTGSGDYKNGVSLSFTHQLAKVRVIIDGTADMKGGKVEIKGYTTCTNEKGIVSGKGDLGWISMHPVTYSDGRLCYEVNLVPATIKEAAFQVTQSNGNSAILNLDAQMTLTAGQFHEITLTVNKSGTTVVDLTAQSGAYYKVADNTSVILDGKGQALNIQLVIGAGSTVMLKNVVLQPDPIGNAITCNGNAILILSGKNKVVGNCYDETYTQAGSGIWINEFGTLTIEGPGELEAIGKGPDGCGIGAIKYASIVINGGTITASSSNPYSHDQSWGCPGIGVCPGEGYEHCGDITINGGHVTALGGPCSAGIGGAAMGNCENILIQGENTVVSATKGNDTISSNPSSIKDIGKGDSGNCGSITFRNGATVNGKKY